MCVCMCVRVRVCASVCGWVNALDLIKCSQSAHALIISVVFSTKSLGDMHKNYDWFLILLFFVVE